MHIPCMHEGLEDHISFQPPRHVLSPLPLQSHMNSISASRFVSCGREGDTLVLSQ